MTSVETPTQAVVKQVATASGVDPLELQPPLFETVNPEALNALVDSADPQTTVQFTYCGYEVTVDGTCTVELEEVSYESDLNRTALTRSE